MLRAALAFSAAACLAASTCNTHKALSELVEHVHIVHGLVLLLNIFGKAAC